MNFDFGAVLDKTINAYESVSVARVERDTAKYNSAGASQAQALHSSEAFTQSESYSTGNAVTPGASQNYWGRIPKPLLYGGMALLGGALFYRGRRR